MRVCHITTMDPHKNSGGVAIAVRYLSKGYDIKYYNSSGVVGVIKSFFLSLRLLFSDYDILHFHDSVAGFFYLIFPKRIRKKTIYTSHGYWVPFFNILPPKTVIEKMKSIILIKMQNYVIKKSDITIAVSKKVMNEIMKNVKPKEIKVIYNGVDTKKFRPRHKKQKYKKALWIGENSKLKNLNAARKIARKRKLELLVVGVEGKSTNDVKYLGKIDYRKMPSIYRGCGLLIYPSRWDGHPLIVLEAMASGLDILAAKDSNIEIIPSKNGWYRIKGKQARKIIMKHDWKNVRAKYKELYI